MRKPPREILHKSPQLCSSRLPLMKSSRSMNLNSVRRQNRPAALPNSLSVRDFSPREVKRIAPDPPPVEFSIKIQKVIQLNIPIPTSGNVSVSPSVLAAGLPGGLTYWSRMRVDKIVVWSEATLEGSDLLSLQLSPSSAWEQPPFAVKDSGTVGNVRARIGLKFGLLDRARWFGTAGTEELCVIASAPDTTVILQASIDVISPGL